MHSCTPLVALITNHLTSKIEKLWVWPDWSFLRSREWTTRQGRNLRIIVHVFLSKFRVENDARNENFKKQLLSEISMYFVSVNSNKPLIKKPNYTCVKSHNKHWLRLDKFVKLYLNSHCSFDLKITKLRQKNHNAKHKERSLIENPIKPFSKCDWTHVDFGFSCERENRIFRNQCQTMPAKNFNY